MIEKTCPFCGKKFLSSRGINSNRDKYCSKECSYKAKIKYLIGQRFGKLLVLGYAGSKNGSLWLCQCDCGNKKIISSRNLLKGVTKSCGCIKKEKSTNIKHGLYYTRLHNIWNGIKSRCYNVNNQRYSTYGKNGIIVCDEWKNDFKTFYNWSIDNGYNETAPRGQYTIDRIDVNGNYEPSNCRWITIQEQQRNKTNTRYVIYNNKRYCIGELAEILNVNYKYIWQKLKRNNWDTSILFQNKNFPEKETPSDTQEVENID